MSAEIIVALISAAALVIVAVLQGKNLAMQKSAEKRARRRATESHLAIQLSNANCKLTGIVAKKVLGHELNGDVKEAMDSMAHAQTDYIRFINETAAEAVTKV